VVKVMQVMRPVVETGKKVKIYTRGSEDHFCVQVMRPAAKRIFEGDVSTLESFCKLAQVPYP